MRKAIVSRLIKLAVKDPGVFLLTGDLGFSYLEAFAEKFPRRFFNIGVAEQNMIGVAAGLALSGKKVFVYSIATFVSMRAFEQIKIDLCYQNLNVKIIGAGAGLSYGNYGATHYALEDVAIMRVLPNMKIFCPANSIEADWVVRTAYQQSGPAYIRSAKGYDDAVYSKPPKLKFGKGLIVKPGKDVALLVSGALLGNALKARKILKTQSISTRIISFPTVKPLDKQLILKTARQTKVIFTLEETSIVGGFGSAVAEILAEAGLATKFKRLALPDFYPEKLGSQAYLRDQLGLSPEKISQTVLKTL
ncbi:1-deoxy-D-xylulose-5-phosphate synthase [Patescibacteria group bacterium]|nr:1-deoxy-D-xylulose-5-phosphate synthase [Patescibacteria group bacterium]MBU1931927.1 1-deoxy-D-xylulose-5-phosphate synthase [Patescibacteria group bacterium]